MIFALHLVRYSSGCQVYIRISSIYSQSCSFIFDAAYRLQRYIFQFLRFCYDVVF